MQLCNMFSIQIHPTQMSIIMECAVVVQIRLQQYVFTAGPLVLSCLLCRIKVWERILKSRLYMCNDTCLLSTAELKTFIPSAEAALVAGSRIPARPPFGGTTTSLSSLSSFKSSHWLTEQFRSICASCLGKQNCANRKADEQLELKGLE